MGKITFYCAFALISASLFLLGHTSVVLVNTHPELFSVFILQFLNIFVCYALLGIGIGLPLVLLAGTLGWLQLVLLMSGNIDPHLGSAGFFKVLNTLFSKI